MKSEEHMIPMRDGIRLQTFVYLPKGEGPFPSLLARCQYGADRMEHRVARLTAEGFAVMLQNIRGRLGSEWERTGTVSSGKDGYDTIEWIVSQPWCNGSVGAFGGSALARVQIATAFLAHPAHRADATSCLATGQRGPDGRGAGQARRRAHRH